MGKMRGLRRLVLPTAMHDKVLRREVETAITDRLPWSDHFYKGEVVIVQLGKKGYAAEITEDTAKKENLIDLKLEEAVASGYTDWDHAIHGIFPAIDDKKYPFSRLSVTRFKLILEEGLPVLL